MSDGTDFADLLRAYAAQHERAATAHAPDTAAEVLALAGRVRRRRLARTSAVVAVGAAAALVGSVAVWGVTRPDPVVPAPQPTHSTVAPLPTSEPTEPAPEPTRSGEPETPEGVTVHALLPKVQPMRADLWAQTDGGWTLGLYRAARDEADGSRVQSPTVLYLVSPDGAAYEVPVPDAVRKHEGADTQWHVTDWLPGQSRAVFLLFPGGKDGTSSDPVGRVVVDLATGEELVSYDTITDSVLLLPHDRTLLLRDDGSDGARVLQVHDRDGYHLSEIGPFDRPQPSGVTGWLWTSGVGVDPTRTQVVINSAAGMSVFDLATSRQLALPAAPAPAQAPCVPFSWLEMDRLVLRCADGGVDVNGALTSQLFVVNLGDGSSRRLTDAITADGSYVTSLWQVGDQVVVGRYTPASDCGQEVALVASDGTQRPVGGVGPFEPTGAAVDRLLGTTLTCAADDASYVAIDPRTGQVTAVAPRIDGVEVTFLAAPRQFIQMDGGWGW